MGEKGTVLDLAEQPDPWELQPTDTPDIFEAFTIYRDQRPPRSLTRVAKQRGTSSTIVARWSAKHDWAARVRAWDQERDRIRREEMIAQIEAMARRHVDESMLIQRALMIPVQAFVERIEKRRAVGEDPVGDLSDRELIKMIDTCARAFGPLAQFERLSRGASTENVAVSVSVGASDVQIAEARKKAQEMSRDQLDTVLDGALKDNSQQLEAASRPRNYPGKGKKWTDDQT